MIVVFAGPTIGHDEVREALDCVCLPPVSHGDIIKLMADPPRAIGIIDGYFEGAPSVWHKEILYALDQGVHVIGASSMGALRAAELGVFGMRGVGQIYEWYRDGVIEDDDEVAVLHGPFEVSFAVASEPMVNIRASLAQAVGDGCCRQALADTLLTNAKATFYKQRSWRSLLETARSAATDEELAQLRDWLSDNAIDLKKRDAVAMLDTMAARAAEFEAPGEPDFHFEWTHVWDTAFREIAGAESVGSVLSQNDADVLDELRLDAERYERIVDLALVAWLAGNQLDVDVDLAATRRALGRFREDNGLATRRQLLDYMSRVGLDEEALTGMMENAARVALVREAAWRDRSRFEALMVDQLLHCGQYPGLLARVEDKRAAGVFADLAMGRLGIRRPQLLAWYFGKNGAATVPDDLARYLTRIDLEPEEFYRVVGREYLFVRG